MKKNKSQSKNQSATKKARKDLESKLTLAFNEVVSHYGKAKKADKVIEKFAKQLSKKINIKVINDSIAPFVKEDEISSPLTEATVEQKEKKATAKPKKAVKTV